MKIIGAGLQRAITPTDLPAFATRAPWFGGDLQTLRNSFVGKPDSLEPDERILAPIDVGAINVAVNRALPVQPAARALVLVHGLGGGEDSSYMLSAARFFMAQGYDIYRMSYRGVGPSAETSQGPYSAGLTSDLRSVLRWVNKYTSSAALYLMGFSLGGQLSLRMLGEGDVPEGLAACVTVSAPLDLATSQKKLERRRNHFYSRYVVNNMKADLAGLDHPNVSVDLEALGSVWDFDQQIIAPVFGFKDAPDYYARVSSLPLLAKITTPTIAIHAANDPWIPVEDYHRAVWPKDVPVGAVITPSGGHVGFHVRGGKHPWHEQAAYSFFSINGPHA